MWWGIPRISSLVSLFDAMSRPEQLIGYIYFGDKTR